MKKYKLILETPKDIKKFINKLWLYKSILFVNKEFYTENKIDEQLTYTIESLNIKRRKNRITNVFDRACDLMDNKNKGINICGFKNQVCEAHRCKNYIGGCCRRCVYNTKTGCPSRNVACKLFNCSTVTSKYEVYTYKDLYILKLLSLKNKQIVRHNYFTLRKDALKDLYSYSYIYSIIRIIIRNIYNIFKWYYLNKNKKS